MINVESMTMKIGYGNIILDGLIVDRNFWISTCDVMRGRRCEQDGDPGECRLYGEVCEGSRSA